MTRCIRLAPIASLALGAFALLIASAASAGKKEIVELDEAEVFVEWNTTDGDFGIQVFWDSDGWKRMRINNPDGKRTMDVRTWKNLREQGMTEGFFESVEPGPDELSMEEFFDRHEEGTYHFRGDGLEKIVLVGEAEFTHELLAPPFDLSPAGGDVVSAAGFTASFDVEPVDLEGEELEIEFCELVLEKEDDEEFLAVLSVILAPGVTSVDVPEQFLEPDTEYKLEVICQEESGNRTIAETDGFSTDG